MKITFYGVRGSTPVPRADMMTYGGNTACVYIQLDDGTNLVCDAGTGIRQLGWHLVSSTEPIHILMSHSHWDHVIGYPFFEPIYQKNRDMYIYPSRPSGQNQLCSLLDQMDGAHFPISAEQLPSKTRCVIYDVEAELKNNGFHIERKPLHHPGGGFAYRVEERGVTCAYITDNELTLLGSDKSNFEEWVDFCRGLDVLIHDAQYVDSDMPLKMGWGHSTVSRVRQLALEAQVRMLVLFHHDPDRTDAQVDAILRETRAFFECQNSGIEAVCAFEGLSIEVVNDDTPRIEYDFNKWRL